MMTPVEIRDTSQVEVAEALIYCRISDKKQRIEGHGLDSQEHRCRKLAEEKGYRVVALFTDDVSGGGNFEHRPGMMQMLEYLEKHRDKRFAVVFDDLKRFARDTLFHWNLRYALKEFGVVLECPNYRFDDSPEGEFVETIFAAQGQLERKQNARQTKQKMQARMECGHWVFPAPPGYAYVGSKGHKVLTPKEPEASIVRIALENYASGAFQTKAEVCRYLHEHPQYNKRMTRQRAHDLLTRVLYAGHLEYKPWNISLRKAQHTPLISFETFQRIQERMKVGAYAPSRKNLNEDFPLRGFVNCECGNPLTAGWTKGRSKMYAYYQCQNKICDHYGRSIRRGDIEGEFEALLHTLTPSEELHIVAGKMFRAIWDHWKGLQQGQHEALKQQAATATGKIDQLLDRIVDTDSPTVVKAYEKKIAQLEVQQVITAEKIANSGNSARPFEETYTTALEFLAKPHKLWASERYEDKRAVLKLAFTERITYVRNEGYTTAKTALPFKWLGDFSGLFGSREPYGAQERT